MVQHAANKDDGHANKDSGHADIERKIRGIGKGEERDLTLTDSLLSLIFFFCVPITGCFIVHFTVFLSATWHRRAEQQSRGATK